MTELGFLIDLMLNHKLPLATRKAIAERIKDVEVSLSPIRQVPTNVLPIGAMPQAASTMAALSRHPDLAQQILKAPEPAPVAVVAQTPAAMAAMESRNRAISESMAGKTDKVTGRPRKF